jgi:hypothetical protein
MGMFQPACLSHQARMWAIPSSATLLLSDSSSSFFWLSSFANLSRFPILSSPAMPHHKSTQNFKQLLCHLTSLIFFGHDFFQYYPFNTGPVLFATVPTSSALITFSMMPNQTSRVTEEIWKCLFIKRWYIIHGTQMLICTGKKHGLSPSPQNYGGASWTTQLKFL